MTYVQTRQINEFGLWPHKHPLLLELDIELTERCNNACIHCLINRPEQDADAAAREMNTAFVKDILRQAADLGCLTVRFTGGEPLLREDYSELYLFARSLGMGIILFTNVRLITPELVRLFERVPPGRVIEVTVYGMHAESYEAATASAGAFAGFQRGLELLRSHNIPFVVKQSVLPSNRGEIDEFEAFAATLPHMERKPGYTMNFDLRGRRDNPAKNRLIEILRLTPEDTLSMLTRDPDYVNEMREFCGKFIGPPGDKLFNCGAGHSICIDAYGKAQMCMGLRHPDMVFDLHDHGAVRSNGFSPLRYALTEFFPRLRETRAKNSDYLNRCARCFLKGLCEQCPAKSWTEHGSLDTPVDYLCQVAHAEARYLGLLGEYENAWDLDREVGRGRVTRFTTTAEPPTVFMTGG
jgi:radical SAM protein with 4Fe4S-binding SPASM domain